MQSVRIRRKILLLVLIAVLAAPLATAAGTQESPRTIQAVEPVALLSFNPIWSFLEQVGSKVGCKIHPNGRCPKEPVQTTKIGCNIDPNGRCIP